jgi:hypothetical protein
MVETGMADEEIKKRLQAENAELIAKSSILAEKNLSL